MTKITFFGGVNEIGGNKILIEDKQTRIFFDFGQSFNFGSNYFTGWLSPRSINGIGDHLEFGLLPKISGLYAQKQLACTNLPYCEPKVNAIFLSHAHFDHVAHISFVDENIPVYLGAGTKLFLESMEDTSTFSDYREHDYRIFRTGKKIKVDTVTVEPVHVDHSIPAAYGFIIHTSDCTIAYTGDFRLHGPRKDLSEDFIKKAQESKPDVLVCEGTRMALNEKRQNFSELQVMEKSNQIVSSCDKIVFSTHYSRDIDRFRSFYDVAVQNGRKLVISPKLAYLLGILISDEHLKIPDITKDEHILVYFKRKKSGTYDDKDYFPWERQFLEKMVNAKDAHDNQASLMMDLDFTQFAELIDIRPEAGAQFIRSMSEPFSEEDIEDEVLHNWLNHFEINFNQLHASGHLNKEQIEATVKQIGAKRVFPVHTENAALFSKIATNVTLPKVEKEYVL